jgi:hypothetical protein
MDNIGKQCKFILFFYPAFFPVISDFFSSFLPDIVKMVPLWELAQV